MIQVGQFQFHKGTIRTVNMTKIERKIYNFNSIKVRLERKSGFSFTAPTLFQFHKGTIRTMMVGRTSVSIPTFQFHKGTIRTHPLS